MTDTVAPFSVIIPAHQEEAVIARCLRAIRQGAPTARQPEIIVVANGCSDATAENARSADPEATVVELVPGSKTAAMNHGSRLASAVPRFFIDADVQCDYRSLEAVAEVLRAPGTLAASPALHMNTSDCDRWVKAYYRVWMTQPYVRDRLIGGGVYGLSAEGLQRLGSFPPIIGDDFYVRTRFDYSERMSVDQDKVGRAVSVTVWPPRNAVDQVRIEARRRAGSDQVNRLYPTSGSGRVNRASDLVAALKNGASTSDVAIYLFLKTCARLLCAWRNLTGKGSGWTRDESSRPVSASQTSVER